ncbi:unnamed protein product [Gadus morhua 'NCC']
MPRVPAVVSARVRPAGGKCEAADAQEAPGNHNIKPGKQGTPCHRSLGVNSMPAFSDGLVETQRLHEMSRPQEFTG